MIPDGRDYEKRICGGIAGLIGFMFVESEIRPELPMELNTEVATRIGSTLTWNNARIVENDFVCLFVVRCLPIGVFNRLALRRNFSTRL